MNIATIQELFAWTAPLIDFVAEVQCHPLTTFAVDATIDYAATITCYAL